MVSRSRVPAICDVIIFKRIVQVAVYVFGVKFFVSLLTFIIYITTVQTFLYYICFEKYEIEIKKGKER